MIRHCNHRGGHYLLLLALGGLMFFANLGGATLWDVDEGRNTTASFEMLQSGNWIVPTFNSRLRVDKPALLYWLQIFSASLFGVSEFSARFPSAVAAMLTVFLCYELARALFSRTTGLLAGVIVATMPMLCGAARFANPDALLNACTVLTLTIFWLGLARRSVGWFALLGTATGLAVLAKGPVGLVLPSGVIFLYLLWEHRLNVYIDMRWGIAALFFTLVAIPWYVWVGLETHGEFLRGFLWTHNVERGLSAMENHRGFPGFYLCVLLAGTAPWSIFLVASWWFALWSAIRQPRPRLRGWWSYAAEPQPVPRDGRCELREDAPATPRRDPVTAYRLLACWIFVYCLFFSVAATKLPNYVLPVIVPCAILIARMLRRWQTGILPLPNWVTFGSAAGLFAVGIVLSSGIAIASGLVELPVMRGRFIHELQPWTLLGLVPTAAGALGWQLLRRRQYRLYVMTVSVSAVLLLGPFAAYGSMILNRQKAPRPLVEEANALSTEDIRIGCWQLESLPSLNFYVQRNVAHLTNEEDLESFLRYPIPVYLFIARTEWDDRRSRLAALGDVVAHHHDFYGHREIVVVTNRGRVKR